MHLHGHHSWWSGSTSRAFTLDSFPFSPFTKSISSKILCSLFERFEQIFHRIPLLWLLVRPFPPEIGFLNLFHLGWTNGGGVLYNTTSELFVLACPIVVTILLRVANLVMRKSDVFILLEYDKTKCPYPCLISLSIRIQCKSP